MARIAALLVIAGCSSPHQDTVALPPGCVGGTTTKDVTFPAADGLVVHATAANPCGGAPRPVVVLSHQMCKDRSEWAPWVAALARRGYATLAIDLRGHGASQTWPDGSHHDLCAERTDGAATPLYVHMADDVTAAIAYARSELHAPQVAAVGTSIGGNSVLVASAHDAQLAAVVALSPGLDYFDLKPEPVIGALAMPTYLEAAEDDADSAAAVKQLAIVNPKLHTKVWPTGGHGNAIIDAHPEERDALVARLADALH